MGGALPIPFAGRAPRGPRMGWIAGGIAASIVPLLIAAVVTMGIPIAAAAAMAIFGVSTGAKPINTEWSFPRFWAVPVFPAIV